MNEFFKIFTIVHIVFQIVNNFITAGGPSINPLIVANESSKELKRKVSSGYLPADVLDGHEEIIQHAINYHPAIQNIQPTA